MKLAISFQPNSVSLKCFFYSTKNSVSSEGNEERNLVAKKWTKLKQNPLDFSMVFEKKRKALDFSIFGV
jgi:hypothetical protein